MAITATLSVNPSSVQLPDADPVTVQCTVTNTGGSTVYLMPPTGTISGTGGIVGQPGGPWPKALAAGASVVINWGVAFFDAGTYQLGATVFDFYNTVTTTPTPVSVTVAAVTYPTQTPTPLSVALGGTGLSAVGSAGQVLASDGAGMVWGSGSGTGTVTSVATSSPLTGGTITSSGTIGIQAASGSQNGYMSSADKAKLDAATASSTAGTLVLRDASGDIYGHDIVATSDERLKANIATIEGALAKVLSMRGVTFEWKNDLGPRRMGLIAQEVGQVVPEVVMLGDGHLGVSYGPLIGLLIEAVKELSARVAAVEAR